MRRHTAHLRASVLAKNKQRALNLFSQGKTELEVLDDLIENDHSEIGMSFESLKAIVKDAYCEHKEKQIPIEN